MARVSFTLRRGDEGTVDPNSMGSFLRYEEGVSYDATGEGGSPGVIGAGDRDDYDSALRADGIQIAPEAFDESFFEAVAACYNEVSLDWGVNIAETLTAEPQVMGVVLVYSDLGEPQTIASGTILVESSSTYSYEHAGVTAGRWAYYSLFVNFRSSGGDNYYERVASLSVLVPYDYGSTMLLWERIPEYYRIRDIELGVPVDQVSCLGSHYPGDGVVGPLFRFLSIIGFDMDRIRTTIDYMMQAKDPYLANAETLDAIADLVAVEMRSQDLGAARLRALLNDIGYYRRSKGTEGAIQYYAKAIAGGDIAIDQEAKEITLYSSRVNYMESPQDGGSHVTWRPAHEDEFDPDAALDFSDSSYSGFVGDFDYTGVTFEWIGSDPDVHSVLIHIDSPVPVHSQDHVVFAVHSGVGATNIQWVRLVDGSENLLGVEAEQTTIEGGVAFEVVIDQNASAGSWTNGYVELLVDLEPGDFELARFIAERNFKGGYFDGDTVRGGWLIDASSISDYRWSGSDNDSVSLYMEDYERTKAILDTLVWDAFPITVADDYTIVIYNGVPGFD